MKYEFSCKSLWMVGAGKMGQALYQAWRAHNVSIETMILIDPNAQPTDLKLKALDQWSHTIPSNNKTPDCLILAVKPQIMADIVPLYHNHLRSDTLIISIAAGISLQTLADLCSNPQQPIIRLIPNTPAMIGQGMTGGIANSYTTAAHRTCAETLAQAAGQFVWLDNEEQMHAVTALSGSGPAYIFALIEALTAAGIAQNLSPQMSEALARQTVIGSAALAAAQPDVSTVTLRQNVTSPNGTTAAGLSVLQASENGLDDLLKRTVDAAAKRSRELGRQSV